MTKTTPSKRKLADTLSALLLTTAMIAPAPAVLAADAPAQGSSSAKKAVENPCGPANPCAPVKKKKKNADNPCAPGNPCAPKKS